ncbi:MAG: DNA helicase PcrA [Cyanobacteria bacterium RI_101]|nr:DNA helicase PcrA [Cyanobacteria bacterium RI_101]
MSAADSLLASLNPSQRAAVQHYCGPLLVVAGAGSGKTRALTYRIAHLIRAHGVEPEHILAVTFTNKAAREMRERLELLFAKEWALEKEGKPWDLLPEYEQKKIRSQVYKSITKKLWIGTFHSLCARILRFDINKYQDERRRSWTRDFSIFDESDVQSLIKSIVTKDLNLDSKQFEPRSLRYKISNAKNLGLSPEDYRRENPGLKGRATSEVYEAYQSQLVANNALDFDDLILVPTRLFEQNETILGYWHQQFRHILVDEYQDTNRIQYDLIRLLATNGETLRENWDWRGRSIFAVGDADQSIYSFRMADFTILLNFQTDFGDGLPDDDTRTMVKLEENYRSRENILQAANALIEHNSQRIDKVLKATRGVGEDIYCYKAGNEQEEARFVAAKIHELCRQNPELNPGSFAVLYRMNAQSRAIEDELIKANIAYTIVGGFKFYDRQEIKDALAYLRVIANPADTVSLLRIINSPRRGIGKTTLENFLKASQELQIPLWEILQDETSVNALAGRAAKATRQFAQLLASLRENLETAGAVDLLNRVLKESGYLADLQNQSTEEADNRIANLAELGNAMGQYAEDNEDNSLQGFLSGAALASDLDSLNENEEKVSLMTLHSAKGLEFPAVFLVGLEQGICPHSRSLNDPLSLEEERRLCYVGVTRAQEQLFISYAQERFVWGAREPAIPSQFIRELPPELLRSNLPARQTRVKTQATVSAKAKGGIDWQVGDNVHHARFGDGVVTHLLGAGRRMNIAVNFAGAGRKILDPRLEPLERR